MYDFPPDSLYQTICTEEALFKRPGAPYWIYDGQFIWMPKTIDIRFYFDSKSQLKIFR